MPDLLTPAELAAIAERDQHARTVIPNLVKSKAHEDRTALLRHIAALEARTPAPALPADMEALLADAENAVANEQRWLKAQKPERDLTSRLTTALRETLAERDAAERRCGKWAAEMRSAIEQAADMKAERDAERARAEKATEQWLDVDAEAGRFLVRAEKAEADLTAARKELAGLKVDLNAKSAENAGYLAALEHLECCCFLPQSDEERAHRAVLRAVILNPTGSRTCVCSNKNYNDQNCPLHSSAVKKAWEERSARAIRRVLEGGAS